MIVAISRLGMDDSITRFFPQSKDRGGFVNALIAIMLLVTIIVIAGFMLGLPYISPALLFLKQWQYALLFVVFVFLTSVCNMQGTALVAIRRADLALLEYSHPVPQDTFAFRHGIAWRIWHFPCDGYHLSYHDGRGHYLPVQDGHSARSSCRHRPGPKNHEVLP